MNQLLDLPLGVSPAQRITFKGRRISSGTSNWAIGIYGKRVYNINRLSPTQRDILPQIFDPLDYDSQRLLPMVYRNLEKSGDPYVTALRGNYRYNWLKGNRFLKVAIEVVGALQKAGFDVMLLKGMPIALLYYKNLGLRPMDDIDIFIPLHQIEDAINFLEGNFELKANMHENELRKLGMFHAIHFTDGKGLDFDLHSHFHIYNLNAEANQPMWDGKIPLQLTPQLTTSTLSPTHQLYRNFTHGYSWHLSESAIRWIPDSLIIMKESANQIDWNGLFELAKKQKFILPRLFHASVSSPAF